MNDFDRRAVCQANMQVLSPAEFSWRVVSATGSPQQSSFSPQKAFEAPVYTQANIAPLFRTPNPTGTTPHNTFQAHETQNRARLDQLTNHVKFLEAEVKRMTEELKVRSGTIIKSRTVQERLSNEVEHLKEETNRLQSIIDTRDKQIEELERQLEFSHSRLIQMKRRYKEAIEEAITMIPGKIKHIEKEKRAIGTQAGDINALEERMSKLVLALRDEKVRNRRIKNMLSLQDDGDSSVPPLPIVDSSFSRYSNRHAHRRIKGLVSRGTLTVMSGDLMPKRPPTKLSLQSTALSTIGQYARPTWSHSHQQFLEIHINGSPERVSAPVLNLNLDSPTGTSGFGLGLGFMSEISPINYQRDSFTVYDDGTLLGPPFSSSSPVLGNSNKPCMQSSGFSSSVVTKKNSSLSTAASMMRPPKIQVPRLNLPSSSSPKEHNEVSSNMSSGRSNASEAAIKRAVAAAIQKRNKMGGQNTPGGGGGGSSIMSDRNL